MNFFIGVHKLAIEESRFVLSWTPVTRSDTVLNSRIIIKKHDVLVSRGMIKYLTKCHYCPKHVSLVAGKLLLTFLSC